MITIDDFKKVEIKVGTVVISEAVEGSEKLIKLTVECGEGKPRTILTGMKAWYQPDYFLDKQILFVSNLEPKTMMGVLSQGMILAVDGEEGRPILLSVSEKVRSGASVR
ncbi:MAG: methionine--tRNA ligase [Candidatus Daviesbacteria bacterium]|nr:methionine--tRNA ligase [Candidatus Daviesbacteria bacterium]